MTEISIEKAISKPSRGLEDGGNIILECSNCLCPLVDVFITTPKLDVKIDVVSHCFNCGDKSFPKEIRGGFHIGGTEYSTIEKMNTDNPQLVECFTVRGEKEWKMK